MGTMEESTTPFDFGSTLRTKLNWGLDLRSSAPERK